MLLPLLTMSCNSTAPFPQGSQSTLQTGPHNPSAKSAGSRVSILQVGLGKLLRTIWQSKSFICGKYRLSCGLGLLCMAGKGFLSYWPSAEGQLIVLAVRSVILSLACSLIFPSRPAHISEVVQRLKVTCQGWGGNGVCTPFGFCMMYKEGPDYFCNFKGI